MDSLTQPPEVDRPSRQALHDRRRPLATNETGAPAGDVGASAWTTLGAYVAIARPDHWFKNVFMLIGIVLAYFYYPSLLDTCDAKMILWAFAATCLIASSNYVLNEILDAATDRAHPVKCARPIPSGRVRLGIAYAEWLALAAAGAVMAYLVSVPFLLAGLVLLGMGLVYNVPPVRSKELPYVDVLSESINNPIRLVLGWFVVNAAALPPLSLLISYWMVGAFFMAAKRLAEYRSLADAERAAAYRSSFRHYDADRLLVSMFFYATASALFLGVFIIRYHLELIISTPLIAGFFGSYMRVTLKPSSPAQAPERLYREVGLMAYLVLCVLVFLALMFVSIPALYHLFNVEPSSMPALWQI